MPFPIIKTIDDVLPHIKGHDEIVVMDKGDYKVIDYLYQQNDTFNHPVRMECRGLIFDKNGTLIRRPFEKFFNFGEKDTFDTVDWTKDHIVMDKRDGSMIAAFMLNGEVRFGTRAGITEHSLKAEERHLTTQLANECRSWIDEGYTPIFEWTAPDNRIVLDYEKSELRLLAIRHMRYGIYVSFSQLEYYVRDMGISLVDEFDMKLNQKKIGVLKEHQAGIEGYVVYFSHNQQRVKIKTDEYSQMHRAVSFFHREDMILPVVLNETYDDILPSLSKDRQEKLTNYASDILKEFDLLALDISATFEDIDSKNSTRKEFALEVQRTVDKRLMSVYFRMLDGCDERNVLRDIVLKHPDLLRTRWES